MDRYTHSPTRDNTGVTWEYKFTPTDTADTQTFATLCNSRNNKNPYPDSDQAGFSFMCIPDNPLDYPQWEFDSNINDGAVYECHCDDSWTTMRDSDFGIAGDTSNLCTCEAPAQSSFILHPTQVPSHIIWANEAGTYRQQVAATRLIEKPTATPTNSPTTSPVTSTPSVSPSTSPTRTPLGPGQTHAPSKSPTASPSLAPSIVPSKSPVNPEPTPPDICDEDDDWFPYASRCYKYFDAISSVTDWGTTRADCLTLDAELASLHDQGELDFAYNLGCSGSTCWVGLYQVQGQEDSWVWSEGYSYEVSWYDPFWASGQFTGSNDNDDCGAIGYDGADVRFYDYSCTTNFFASVCVKEASCPAGWKKVANYDADSSNNEFNEASCEICPAGSYRGESDPETSCIPCPGGSQSSSGSETCDITCPYGYYCPEGTAKNDETPCPAGKYGPNNGQASAEDACLACDAGYYCEEATINQFELCLEGYCGFEQATESTCSQQCTAGYRCPEGSACPVFGEAEPAPAYECGDDTKYCPTGTGNTAETVTDGYYTVGGTSTTRTAEVICSVGYYCENGVEIACPKGRYGETAGLSDSLCTGACRAGSFCDLASVSIGDDRCAPDDAEYPATYYCPEGTTERLIVGEGNMSLPLDANVKNRESQGFCPDDKVCVNGEAVDKLSWIDSSICGDSGSKYFIVEEMSDMDTLVATLEADLADIPTKNLYSINYTIDSFVYIDEVTYPLCSPIDNETNANIFYLPDASNGEIRVLNDINFETCLPVIDMRYKLTVNAHAYGEGTVSNINCEIEVEIDDLNDDPSFTEEITYRMIDEKQLANTPATRCDSVANSVYGCPVVENNLDPNIEAIDGDDPESSIITYEFVDGKYNRSSDPEDYLFKINRCTGIISYRGNNEVSFADKNTRKFTFEVVATDDGNGGRFEPKNTTQIVVIYIINLNDPPIMPTQSFQVYENQDPGFALLPLSLLDVQDEDPGDTFTLFIIQSNSDAEQFDIDDDNNLITSVAGSSNIDYESTQKSYTITIQADDGNDGGQSQADYTIVVLDANDPPEFDNQQTSFFILENSMNGSLVCGDSTGVCDVNDDDALTVHALQTTDEDNLDTDITTFELITQTDKFEINSTTGQIFVKSDLTNYEDILDFEDLSNDLSTGTGRGFTVGIRATSDGVGIDSDPKSSEHYIIIYIVDDNEKPIVSNDEFDVSIYESWPVSFEIDIPDDFVSVTDPDNSDITLLGELAPQQDISFYISDSCTEKTFTSNVDGYTYFSVSTGSDNKPSITLIKELNYEDLEDEIECNNLRCLKICLIAEDNGGPIRRSTEFLATIYIENSNEPPQFVDRVDNYQFSIAEDSPVELTEIIDEIFGSDEDNDTLSITVTGGTGAGLFELVDSTYQSVILRKQANEALNYERFTQFYSLELLVADQGPSSFIGKYCEFNNGVLVVDCGSSGGATCINNRCYEVCSATDDKTVTEITDKGYINQYFCNYTNEADKLTLYEETATITITINIEDRNDAPLIVDTDNDPFNDNCNVTGVVQNNKPTSVQNVVNNIEVYDDDDQIPSDTYGGSPFYFTPDFNDLNNNDEFWDNFDIDLTTGTVSYKGNNAVSSFSIGKVFEGVIRVNDSNIVGNNGTSTCNVQITLIEANENPTFDLVTINVADISEDSPINTVVVESFESVFSDIDADIGIVNDEFLTFSTSYGSFFELNSTSGQIDLGSDIDYESLSNFDFEFTITLRVTDSYGADAVTDILVPITDVNENPVWVNIDTIYIDENLPNGFIFYDVSLNCSDPDIYAADHGNPEWNTLTFEIDETSCPSASCPFAIDSSGQLSVKDQTALDYEALTNSWSILIIATDGGLLSTSKTITITLQNVNEAPFFLTGIDTLFIDENDENVDGTELLDLSVLVNDYDANDPISSLTFTLIGGGSIFKAENGFLKVNDGVILDFEETQSYEVDVTVEDIGGLSANEKVTIKINNINDVEITNMYISDGGIDSNTLACNGTTEITIEGKNFGLKNNSITQPNVQLSYKRTNINAVDVSNSNKIYVILDCFVTTDDNVEMKCIVPRGVGNNLNWELYINVPSAGINDTFTYTTSKFSYQKPIIEAVSSNVSDALTIGGQKFTISGQCFGDESDLLILSHQSSSRDSFVEYCATTSSTSSDQTCYIPSCEYKELDVLECITEPGIGYDFEWQVQISASKAVNSPKFKYGKYANPSLFASSIDVISTDGQLSSNIIFSGNNFGAENSQPTIAKLVYNYISTVDDVTELTIEYNLLNCYVVDSNRDQITCDEIDPGVGYNMSVIFEFGGQQNNENEVFIDYESATIISISGDGASESSTLGGELVTITGTSFGPQCGQPAADNSVGSNDAGQPCTIVKMRYSNGSPRYSIYKSSGGTIVEELIYYPSCAVLTQTTMVCKITPGTGENHLWNGILGNQEIAVASDAGVTSYAAPSVSSYSSFDISDTSLYPTPGNDSVIIEGSNFGPLDGAQVYAFYGDDDNEKEFSAGDCEVIKAHEQILCYTIEGAGHSLAWIVYVDDIESRTELTDYAPPAITGIDIVSYSTEGGEVVQISGTNFGPPSYPGPYLETVYYGPITQLFAYEGENCQVISHELIECETKPGIGSKMRWRISVKGQSSSLSSITTSYKSPELYSIDIDSGISNGGFVSRLNVSNIGLCDENSKRKILFGNKEVDVSNIYTNDDGYTNPKTFEDCPINNDNGFRILEFTVPERDDLPEVDVNFKLSSSILSNEIESISSDLKFIYDEPFIDLIFSETSSAVTEITLTGENFCSSSDCCKAVFNNIEVTNPIIHNHNRIKFSATAPAGIVYVECSGGQISNNKTVVSSSPVVTGTVPRLDSYEFDTQGGETVAIWGLNFGNSSIPRVTIGGYDVQVISHQQFQCEDIDGVHPNNFPQTAADLSYTTKDECYRTEVIVNEGFGQDLDVIVYVADDIFSIADDTRFEFLSYKAPEISSISGVSSVLFNTDGTTNNVVTIGGNYFGTNGSVIIGDYDSLDDEYVIECNILTYSHSQITCLVGEGEGTDLSVKVVQGINIDNPLISTAFGNDISYKPPSSLSFNDRGYETAGNELFTINGINLGRNLQSTVTIDGENCIVVNSSHTYINCLTNEGEGIEKTVVVDVASQQVEMTNLLFDYGAPYFTMITPLNADTSAKDENNEQIILTIEGGNFGIDELTVIFDDIEIGRRSSFDEIEEGFISISHNKLELNLPAYYGKDIIIEVIVDGQSSSTPQSLYFSYNLPTVEGATVIGSDGLDVEFQTGLAELSNENSAGFGNVNGGRRVLQNGNSGQGFAAGWDSNGLNEDCIGDYRVRNTFWRESWSITQDGSYTKVVQHYLESTCETETFQVTVKGEITDLGTNNVLTCGQSFENRVTSIVINSPDDEITDNLNDICKCNEVKDSFDIFTTNTNYQALDCFVDIEAARQQNILDKLDDELNLIENYISPCYDLSTLYHTGSRYGMYTIVNENEIYFSRLFETIDLLESAAAFGLKDTPDAIASVYPTTIGPIFPTDGCYIWESNSEYNSRRKAAFQNLGQTAIPRLCKFKSLVTITGSNFGVNSFNKTGVLRVTFEDPKSGDRFEASTTSAQGNHVQLCEECVHTHNKISFWVPLGSGRGLRVYVVVGGQEKQINLTANYEPPSVTGMFPGTIFRKAPFQNALGELVVVQGENFGWTGSSANILINGRTCNNTEWIVGSNGEPYIECIAQQDTVGPKSIHVCIANQTAVSEVFRTDVEVLKAGEAANAWAEGTDVVQTDTNGYSSRVFSYTVTRCPAGYYGQIFEKCVKCEEGSICGDGSFAEPVSDNGFYKIDIDKTAEAERAEARCVDSNEEDLILYPDLIIRDTCLDFVRCEPAEACLGNNECAKEYLYAFDQCVSARDSITKNGSYVNGYGVSFSSNTCNVTLDPYTNEWSGVHSDCRGDVPMGTACDYQSPIQCSTCELVFSSSSNDTIPTGICTCEQPKRCGLCTMFTHYRLNNECQECPENIETIIVLFCVGALFGTWAAYFLSKRQVNLAFVAITVDYVQVLAVFSSTKIQWPEGIKYLFNLLSIFNLNIDIAAPECLIPSFEYDFKFYITELMPLAGLAVLLAIHITYSFYKIVRDKLRVKFTSHISKLISVFLIIMYFLYLTVTRRALDVFNCNPVAPSDGYLYTEFTSIRCDGGGLCRCDEPGGVQQSLAPAAIAFLILYSFGFPVFVFVITRVNKSLIKEDQYLRAHNIGETRITNPDAYDLRKRYHLLYMYYKPDNYYWGLVILYRKFMIAFSALIFRGNPVFQMSVILLVLFSCFVLQTKYRPYLSTGEKPIVLRELEQRAAEAVTDPKNFGADYEMLKKVNIAVKISQEQSKHTKNKYQLQEAAFWGNDKLDKKKRKERQVKNFRNRASGFFFDFNTCEAILIGCSIYISLCGIMFQSGRFEDRKTLQGQQDAVTYSMVIVIIFSFFYIFLIFLNETAPTVVNRFLSRFMKHSDALEEELDQGVTLASNPLMNVQNKIGHVNADELENQLEVSMASLVNINEQNKALKKDLEKIESQRGQFGSFSHDD